MRFPNRFYSVLVMIFFFSFLLINETHSDEDIKDQ